MLHRDCLIDRKCVGSCKSATHYWSLYVPPFQSIYTGESVLMVLIIIEIIVSMQSKEPRSSFLEMIERNI